MLRWPEQPCVCFDSYKTVKLRDTRAANNAPDIIRRAKLKKKTAKRSSPICEPLFAASYQAFLIATKTSNRSS
jgi:hypothetical protein